MFLGVNVLDSADCGEASASVGAVDSKHGHRGRGNGKADTIPCYGKVARMWCSIDMIRASAECTDIPASMTTSEIVVVGRQSERGCSMEENTDGW